MEKKLANLFLHQHEGPLAKELPNYSPESRERIAKGLQQAGTKGGDILDILEKMEMEE